MDSISELAVFVEVVRCGSFVGAAGELGITASGVSKKINKFEVRLGVRLFNRTTRSLALTEAGEALYEQSEQILESISTAEDLARDLSGSPRGQLRIAASAALSVGVIMPFLKKFGEKFSGITTTTIQADGGIDMIRDRIDVALLFERPAESSLIIRKMIDDPWIVCAAPEYLKRFGKPETPNDLETHRCLTIHARNRTEDHWDFEIDGKTKSIAVDSAHSGIGLALREAALQGVGIARLAHFLVCQDVLDGRLVPLLCKHAPVSERAIYAVYPDRKYLPLKIRVFVDHLQAHMVETMIQPISRGKIPNYPVQI
ncbi:MAG: LysR family transcriptional regulator [Pseudomonadota bacterium]